MFGQKVEILRYRSKQHFTGEETKVRGYKNSINQTVHFSVA